MFKRKVGTKKSILIGTKNTFLRQIQNTTYAQFVRNSLFFENIDKILYTLLILTIISTAFLSTGFIGLFAFSFSVVQIIKLLTKKGARTKIQLYDKAILVYFIFVLLSLLASSNFALSFVGFLKTGLYILFYFSALTFFIDNKKKLLPIIILIASLASFESIVAIIQNHSHVLELAKWQDTSYLDPTQIISRSYGTLKPYNPNLLAGYLLATMPFLYCISMLSLKNKNYKRFTSTLLLVILSTVAIIYTGSRGAYIGLFAFFVFVIASLSYYIKKFKGGFSEVKKRYKNLVGIVSAAIFAFIVTNPAITSRIASIFKFHQDSSISFRLHVYEASMKMFLDNPFLGIGVGNKNFREIYGLYMKSGYDALASYSVPLEIAVESGIFALIAFSVFLAFWIKSCLKVIKKGDVTKKIIATALLLTVVVTMTHGLFDTIFFRPQVQIIFWANVAMLAALNE